MQTWVSSLDDCATAQLSLGVAQTFHEDLAWKAAATKVTSGGFPVRGRGNAKALRWTAPAGADWSYAKGAQFGKLPR